ncbi:MAG: carboxylesterase family protein, partial [Mycobacterium sp.]
FDPTRMAVQGDVVVVTVDSRLGIFGYFGHPGLAGSGTFGLQDQQSALRWVRRNAAAFGGEPGNVTLFGESGGAIAACDHLVSPSAVGLFDKVILQSGSCALSWPANGPLIGAPAGSFARPRQQVEQAGTPAAARLGCPGSDNQVVLDCLRRLPTGSLLPHANEFGVVATGTALLPRDPAAALADGQTPRVPVISGHTRDESRLIAAISELLGNPVTDQDYRQLLTEAFGARTPEVETQYPRADYESAALAWSAINTDRMFACTQLTATRELATRMPTYAYEFADENAPGYAPFPPGFPPGASHGSELVYLFDVAGKPSDLEGHPIPLTAAQKGLSSAMIRYWTRFAHTGNPNRYNAPQWRQWHGDRTDGYGYVQALAPGTDGIGPVDDNRAHHCDFWSTFS